MIKLSSLPKEILSGFATCTSHESGIEVVLLTNYCLMFKPDLLNMYSMIIDVQYFAGTVVLLFQNNTIIIYY